MRRLEAANVAESLADSLNLPPVERDALVNWALAIAIVGQEEATEHEETLFEYAQFMSLDASEQLERRAYEGLEKRLLETLERDGVTVSEEDRSALQHRLQDGWALSKLGELQVSLSFSPGQRDAIYKELIKLAETHWDAIASSERTEYEMRQPITREIRESLRPILSEGQAELLTQRWVVNGLLEREEVE